MLNSATKELTQGSQEWREARSGLVTGSRVGAILGHSPFASANQVLKEMVGEHHGEYKSFRNVAMTWGVDHEDEAIEYAQFISGLLFEDRDFRTNDIYGYSPDGVSDCGVLLEVKCPYKIREDMPPEFKTLADQPHYMDQIQFGMMMTGCHRALFIQWTPNGAQMDWVDYEENWHKENAAALEDFIARFHEAKDDPSMLNVERSDEEWKAAGADYLDFLQIAEIANRSLADAKAVLIELSGGSSCKGEGVQVIVSERKGTLDYKKVPEVGEMIKALPKDYVEQFRNKPSTVTTVKVSK